jgi:hypothetical protein
MSDTDTVYNRLHAFIYSLFVVTREELETIASKNPGDYLPTAHQITIIF